MSDNLTRGCTPNRPTIATRAIVGSAPSVRSSIQAPSQSLRVPYLVLTHWAVTTADAPKARQPPVRPLQYARIDSDSQSTACVFWRQVESWINISTQSLVRVNALKVAHVKTSRLSKLPVAGYYKETPDHPVDSRFDSPMTSMTPASSALTFCLLIISFRIQNN